MENVTRALYMAFAMFVFIIALSYSIHIIKSFNTTSKLILYRVDGTNVYESIELKDFDETSVNNDIRRARTVGIDTIIPTLYRYYKESYSVKILDEAGNLMQYFDTTTEGSVMTAMGTVENKRTDTQKALISLYGTADLSGNLFGAPWMGNTNKDTKARIDMYISGEAGYINNTWVDYSKKYDNIVNDSKGKGLQKYIYLNYYKDRLFKENFAQYAYEGDTLTTEDDELETLTGSHQISTKIIITYQLLPDNS